VAENKLIKSSDYLPKVDRLLLEDQLTEMESRFFAFAESHDGRVYCVISQRCQPLLRKRAQTIRSFYFGIRETVTLVVSEEMLHIFRDQAEAGAQTMVASSTELDAKFSEVLVQAIRAGASDIHYDIFVDHAELKFRIHGLLFKIGEINVRSITKLINYVYNVAAAEGSKDTQYNSEEMQDALLDRYLEVDGKRRHYKLRLQTAPCYPNSITIVMRILPVDTQINTTIDILGYSHPQIQVLRKAQMKPVGVTIIAGTTGSGKSTTLATLLSDICRRTAGSKKVLTAEDPPEYTIPGANQINLSIKRHDENEDDNIFVKAIKVAMRCDPDIIMVGEVRDGQSASLLSSAVLSGHQVFTTVHASSALGIFDRLINMGFERSVITAPNFLSLLVYQVLLPTVCPECSYSMKDYFAKHSTEEDGYLYRRLEQVINSDVCQRIMSPLEAPDRIRMANYDGCSQCRHGFNGRTVVSEMVEPDINILECFKNDNFQLGYDHWRTQGGRLVIEHAIDKCLAGVVDPRSVEDKCGLMSEGDVC
jgi:type II secretory ATPase GspE/PulE/Tfp pilus assembly ATPase PilB-like protein